MADGVRTFLPVADEQLGDCLAKNIFYGIRIRILVKIDGFFIKHFNREFSRALFLVSGALRNAFHGGTQILYLIDGVDTVVVHGMARRNKLSRLIPIAQR